MEFSHAPFFKNLNSQEMLLSVYLDIFELYFLWNLLIFWNCTLKDNAPQLVLKNFISRHFEYLNIC
jgi:hypothetical protein